MRMEQAHLYVEKYSRREGELLLDFVREEEFLFFKYYGDLVPSARLAEGQYEPTMLLCVGAPDLEVREGDIIIVDMDRLLALRRVEREFVDRQEADAPATVFLEIRDAARLAELLGNAGGPASSDTVEHFTAHFESSRDGSPCGPCSLSGPFELRVWNVGQGNTNSVSDQYNLTLFDFGASMYHSKAQLRAILHNHAALLQGKDRISLILSHWDVDHFNLLCAVSDAFLRNLCCVCYPSSAVGLAATQIEARLRTHCRSRAVISPPQPAVSRRCGVKIISKGSQYTLFTGEACRDKNKSGLLLEVHGKTATALLTADHSNYQVWNRVYPNVGGGGGALHVVVPHHGGDCGRTMVQPGSPSGIAAISVGGNSYRHPCPGTIKRYQRAGYHVMFTDRCGRDIVIPMH